MKIQLNYISLTNIRKNDSLFSLRFQYSSKAQTKAVKMYGFWIPKIQE